MKGPYRATITEGSMEAAMRASIERPNSRHRRGIWAYMDIRDNGIIKDTYRTIKDTIGTHNPRPICDLFFDLFYPSWCPYRQSTRSSSSPQKVPSQTPIFLEVFCTHFRL
jgi:hypothetical protein